MVHKGKATTTCWAWKALLNIIVLKLLWAKRKASSGGFRVLFFKTILTTIWGAYTQFKKRNFIEFLPENEIFVSFFPPSMFHSCNLAIWNLKMFRKFYFEIFGRHAVGKIFMITVCLSYCIVSEYLLLCTEYFCKKQIFVILITSFLQTLVTGQAGG